MRVLAPATSANLGPGFDTFGIALERPWDIIEVREVGEGIRIEAEGFPVPVEPGRNVAEVVARGVLARSGLEAGVEIRLEKRIRPMSGLGSSAASAAGTAFALRELFELPMGNLELVELALAGEALVSGEAHADNLAPCIYGGFTIAQTQPLEVETLEPPGDAAYAVLLPEVLVGTREARAVLPRAVDLELCTSNLARASMLVAGVCKGDIRLMGGGMEDRIFEPLRSGLIPHYREVKEGALKAGAAGVAISGSGPAIMALCDSRDVDAGAVAEAMGKVYAGFGLHYTLYHGRFGAGCRVL
ncbi:MAG: homoserine kinase [Candidatus Hydrothermarchaeota archaeon]